MNSHVPAINVDMAEKTRLIFSPASAQERVQWLDALRGFALLGILLYNVDVFSGYAFLAPTAQAQLAWSALDRSLDFLLYAMIQGKFYALFSFLFGLGFALQLRRAASRGAAAEPMLRRRMAWLLLFGLVHATLIWWGDILTVYALFGFALLLFRRVSQRTLLVSAIFFLASPVLIYLVFLALRMPDPFAANPATPPAESLAAKLTRAFATGDYIDIVQSNAVMYAGGWIRRALRLALPRIFGMFLLGAWAAGLGLPATRDAHRPLLQRCLWWGLLIGLPLNLGFAALGAGDVLLPASNTGLLAITLTSLGIPLLSLAYVAAFALYWQRRRDHSLLVASGRMPLSNYLAQSLACGALFYGIGFGLWGQTSYGISVLLALALYAFLSALSRAWLRRHSQGPIEALWRRLSYRRAA